MNRNLNICFLKNRWKLRQSIRLKVGQRNKDVIIAQKLTDSLSNTPEWPGAYRNWISKPDWIKLNEIILIKKRRWDSWDVNTSKREHCRQKRESEEITLDRYQ